MSFKHAHKHHQAMRFQHNPKHRHAHIPDISRTLDEYWDNLLVKNCVSCGTYFDRDQLKCDETGYGWMLNGMENPQWIYVHCRNCGYDSSINKLGIPQEVF